MLLLSRDKWVTRLITVVLDSDGLRDVRIGNNLSELVRDSSVFLPSDPQQRERVDTIFCRTGTSRTSRPALAVADVHMVILNLFSFLASSYYEEDDHEIDKFSHFFFSHNLLPESLWMNLVLTAIHNYDGMYQLWCMC